MAMDERVAYDLLVAVITSEESAMHHMMECKTCDGTPTCPEGRHLMAENIEATLAAKVFIDRSKSPAVPRPRPLTVTG